MSSLIRVISVAELEFKLAVLSGHNLLLLYIIAEFSPLPLLKFGLLLCFDF
jgi:hypothetical protein